MTKKKIITFIILILVTSGSGYAGYAYYKQKKDNNTLSTSKESYYTVGTGDILSSIKVLGETSLLNEQKLKFNIEWTVLWVYVTEGKKVKTGDLLAELDKGQLKNELKEANIGYDNAKMRLDALILGLSGDEKTKEQLVLENLSRKIVLLDRDYTTLIANNRIKLEEKNKELEQSIARRNSSQKEAQINLDKLKLDITDQKKDLDYKRNTLADTKWSIEKSILDEAKGLDTRMYEQKKFLTDTYEDVNNDIASLYDSIRGLNEALEIDSEYKTLEQNVYFSAKNSSYRASSDSYYWKSKWALKTLELKYKEGDGSSLDIAFLIELIGLKKLVYENLYLAGDFTAKWAENSIEAADFSLSSIASIKSLSSGIRSSAYTSKMALPALIQKLQTLDSIEIIKEKSRIATEKLQKERDDLSSALSKSDREYANVITMSPEKVKELAFSQDKEARALEKLKRDIVDLERSTHDGEEDKRMEIQIMKQDYKIATKNFQKKFMNIEENEEVKLARNTIKQSQIVIDQVNKKIENYELRASFDGVIGSYSMKTGDKLTNAATTDERFIQLANPGLMEVRIKLDQIDIVKVAKGMETKVTFDAYPDKVFTGSLWAIDSKPIDENGVKKYQTKVIIDKGDLNIFSGMSANVDLVLAKKENVLLVPTMSIETDNDTGMHYMSVMRDGWKVKQNIEVGINGDGNTEVLSGAILGDQVLEINFDANAFKPEDFSQPTFGG